MCGLAGFMVSQGGRLCELETLAARMAGAVQHRGPDDHGSWASAPDGIGLGHRRLAIVDLSPAGHQPMASAGGRFVIAFNGEIYNHAIMRSELEANGVSVAWRGHSDTETLLAAFEHWGLRTTLTKAVGMFAMAVWDVQERTLHLARDRFGEKPLYYGWVGAGTRPAFAFGSELKALRAFPGFANAVCRQALVQYMRFMYVPAPRSIYQGIYKLEPGCLLSIKGAAPASAPAQPLRPPAQYDSLSLQRWWSLSDVVQAGAQNKLLDESEAVDALEQRLSEAVRIQSLADVPLGAFLSGGVDSSTIVALMQQQAKRPVKTFTVGFEEAEFDESPHARVVAKHFGTDHAELFVTSVEARAVISKLPAMYDEPFADSSQIPTHLVCHAARQHVTVALSGDAGDELFGGYNRYLWGPRIWNRLAWLPYPARQALGAFLEVMPEVGWSALSRPMNALLPRSSGIARVGEKANKLAGSMRGVRSLEDLYVNLVSEWKDPAQVVLSGGGSPTVEPLSLLDDPLPGVGVDGDESPLRMMYRDSMTYLPDDILCKVDRAAMFVGLETRVPFLDHRVAELAWQLPLRMKIRQGEGKWAVRQVLYKYVPQEFIDRPKEGFAIPIGQWLRGPLREWAEGLLDQARLEREGFFNPSPIRKIWLEHLQGRHDWTSRLWTVLMFQAWLEDC